MNDDKRLIAYRKAVFAAIKKQLEIDSHCKSYEGAITISKGYPNYFEQDKKPEYCLHLACYVLGPTRGYDYFGKTIDECLDKAEADLKKWNTNDLTEAKCKQ